MSQSARHADRKWKLMALGIAAALGVCVLILGVLELAGARRNAREIQDGTLVKHVNQGMLSFFNDARRPASMKEAIRLANETDSIPGPLRMSLTGAPILFNPGIDAWRRPNAHLELLWVEDPSGVWAHCAWGDGHVEFLLSAKDHRPDWLDQAIDGGEFDELFEKRKK